MMMVVMMTMMMMIVMVSDDDEPKNIDETRKSFQSYLSLGVLQWVQSAFAFISTVVCSTAVGMNEEKSEEEERSLTPGLRPNRADAD